MSLKTLSYFCQITIAVIFLSGSLIIAIVGGRFFPFSDYNMFAHKLNKEFVVISQLQVVTEKEAIDFQPSLPRPVTRWFLATYVASNLRHPQKLKAFLESLKDEAKKNIPDALGVRLVIRHLRPYQEEFFAPFKFEVIRETKVHEILFTE